MKRFIATLLTLTLLFTSTLCFAHPFGDVSSHWAEAEISAAFDRGLIAGDGTGDFRPDDNITRAEFMKILSALIADNFDIEIAAPLPGAHWAAPYYDFAVSAYLYPFVELNYNNVSPGVMDSSNFDIPIKRWEMAYMLDNAFTNVYNFRETTPSDKINDIAKIKETYDDIIVKGINSLVMMEIIRGDEKGNFNPEDNGTRAEAIALFARSAEAMDIIAEYYETLQAQQESAIKAQEEALNESKITYEKIPTGHPVVEFKLSDGRKFEITLYPEYAPQTCANFMALVNNGFYNGLTFHRVIDGFMAQGGDPNGDGTGGAKNTIFGEFSSNGWNKNTLSHKKGVVSMARSSLANSASSQFFICYDDASFLDGQYAAFGKVTSGMNVIESFQKVERTENAMGEVAIPVTPITISTAKVLKK